MPLPPLLLLRLQLSVPLLLALGCAATDARSCLLPAAACWLLLSAACCLPVCNP
jgi:hypothetical protein